MSDDKATIPDELRIAASWEHSQLGTLCEKAADEIDRQAAQIAMLREALDDLNSISPDDGHGHIQMVRKEADRALAATEADVEAWEKQRRDAVLKIVKATVAIVRTFKDTKP